MDPAAGLQGTAVAGRARIRRRGDILPQPAHATHGKETHSMRSKLLFAALPALLLGLAACDDQSARNNDTSTAERPAAGYSGSSTTPPPSTGSPSGSSTSNAPAPAMTAPGGATSGGAAGGGAGPTPSGGQ